MKKCSRCSKPATLHITDIRDNVVQELHLCEGCAQDYLSNPLAASPDPDQDVISEQLSDLAAGELDQLDRLNCPHCGISFREFRSQGRLGCPQDYEVFADELDQLLENIHGETLHTGKRPQRAPGTSGRQFELIRLRRQLQEAVTEEDYESAARLRDEIRTTESSLEVE